MSEETPAKFCLVRLRRTRFDVMKKGFFIYFLGFFSGAVVLGLFLFLRGIGEGMSHWGETVVYSDAEVRAHLKDASIQLPEGAHDLYFAIEGFRDHTAWIKFTVPQDQLWKTVRDRIHQEKVSMSTVVPEFLSEPIMNVTHRDLDLSWWNPKEVRHPLSWKHQERNDKFTNFEEWLVDEEKSTIYATWGNL